MLKNVGVFVFSSLICLLLLEFFLGYRYSAEHSVLAAKYSERDLCTIASSEPGLIYAFIPGKCGANAQGYLDVGHKLEGDHSSFRIVLIGDSVAQGQGVALEDSFGKVLEKKLIKKYKDQNIELIILARSGYSTSQELILLRNEAFQYHPDLILWSYVLNDPAHPIFHNANGELGRFFYEPPFYTQHLIKKMTFNLRERFSEDDCDPEYHQRLHCVYWDQVASHISEIGVIASEQDVPVLFFVHPVFEENNDFSTYSFRDLHEKLAKTAEAAGLYVADLTDNFEKFTPAMLHLSHYVDGWWDPWHPNKRGHRLIADQLLAEIEAHHLVVELNTSSSSRTR